jgi:hypothetical protein
MKDVGPWKPGEGTPGSSGVATGTMPLRALGSSRRDGQNLEVLGGLGHLLLGEGLQTSKVTASAGRSWGW